MAKSRDAKNSEFYLGQIRDLKKQVKSLQKRLKQLERQEHVFRDREDLVEEIIPDLPVGNQKKLTCDDCFKGYFEEFEILGKIIVTCNVCGHRKRLK